MNYNSIIQMAETHSYNLVGEYFGISRNAVAGIVWRHKTKGKKKVSSNGGHNNKLGCGHHGGVKYKHKIF